MPELATQPRLSSRMLSKRTGQWEQVPQESVANAYLSGDYGLERGQEIPIVSPRGQKGTIPAQNLQKALKQGFRLETSVERQDREMDEKYGDKTIEAMLAGSARGLSFGLSDLALRKMGVSEERLREVKARNKGAAYSAEAAGVLLPMLFTGGTSAAVGAGVKGTVAGTKAAATGIRAGRAARIIKTAGILPRAAAKAGASVERAIAKRLIGSGANKAATKSLTRAIIENAAPRAAGSLVEGSFYGAGHLVSEHALGNADINAQTILSHVGPAALFSGGVGALTKIPGVLVNRGAARVAAAADDLPTGKATTFLQRVKGKVAGKADDVIAKEADAGAEGLYATPKDVGPYSKQERAAGMLGGVDKQSARYYKLNKQAVDDAIDYNDIAQTMSDDFKRLGDEVLPDFEKQVTQALEESNVTYDTKEVFDFISKRIKNLRGRTKGIASTDDEAISALSGIRDRLIERSKPGAAVKFKRLSPEQARKTVQGLRKDVQNAWTRAGRMDGKLTASEAETMAVSEFLDKSVLKKANPKYAGLMKDYSKAVGVYKDTLRMFGRKYGEKGFKDMGKTKALRGYAKEMDDGIMRKEVTEAMDKFSELTGRDYRTMFRNRALKEQIFGVADTMEINTEVLAGNLAKAFAGRMTPGGRLMGATGTLGAARQLATGVRGKAFKQVLSDDPTVTKQLVEGLGSMERMINKQWKAINEAVTGTLGTKRFTGRPVAIPVSTNVLMNTSFSPEPSRKPKDRQDALALRREELAELVQNPEAMIEFMSESIPGLLEVAPETGELMMNKAAAAIQFLWSKVPKDNRPPGILPHLTEYKPSDMELAKFERYTRAVQDPLTVFKDMSQGKLSREGVEVLRSVYPEMFSQIQSQMIETMTELKTPLPYAKRVQLSILFGTPVDGSMRPEFIRGVQESYARKRGEAQQKQQASPPRNNTVRKIGTLTSADQLASESQRLSGR